MFRRLPPAAIAVAAFFGLVAFARSAIPLIDGDVWWHIRAGREILASGRIPTTDTWSIVTPGARWTSQDWLSNVTLAALHDTGDLGPTLVSLFYAGLVVLGLVLLWFALSARGARGWLGRIAWLAVGLTVAGATIGVRVQVIDLPLAAAAVLLLWRYVADRRRGWLIGLPIISIAWANLHAGWVVLFLLGGAVLVGESIDRVLGRRGDEATPPLRWGDIAWLCGALAVSLLAIALNPNGFALYAYPLETSLIAAHRDFLAEWSPPDIATLPGQLLAAFVVLGVLPAVVLGGSRARAADLLILLGLTVMATSAARFLLLIPIAAAEVALLLGPTLAHSSVGCAMTPVLDSLGRPARGSRLGLINLTLASVMVGIGMVVAVGRVSPVAQRAAIGEHMPVVAVDWLLAHPVGERSFNTYSWGGYLGFRRPDLPVYIDGRSDIYGDGPIRDYAEAVLLITDPAALLDRHDIDHILFNTDTPFAQWLNEHSAWEQVYTDPLASIWARR